jgi:hypothetical protein
MCTSCKAMRVGALVLTAFLVRALCDSFPDTPTRGRPHLNGKTLVTDWNTLLRMACWSLDMQHDLPARDELKTIKECGVNALHVYFERYDEPYARGRVGHNAEKMDTLVEWCRQESLYVVMTIGGTIVDDAWSSALQGDLDSTIKIWSIYAPRYANKTHVVYEIKNESGCGEVPIERAVCPIIREVAPETHMLLCSISNTSRGSKEIIDLMDSVSDVVDWNNTSVAFHGYGYGVTGDTQERVIQECNDAGYCMTMTECWPNTGLEEHYEHAQISYMPMAGCFGPMASQKCAAQHKLNISYAPDFGSWPQQHVEHLPVPVEALYGPAAGVASGRRSALLFPLTANSFPWAGVHAVYDLSGRLLWRQRGNGAGAAGMRSATGVARADSRVLVARYEDK